MKKSKIVSIVEEDHLGSDYLLFDTGEKMYSKCYEDGLSQFLNFKDLDLSLLNESYFDLTSDNFFNRIEDYGI